MTSTASTTTSTSSSSSSSTPNTTTTHRSLVIVLCGLPAAGKTTLAREIVRHYQGGGGSVRVEHICYDRIYQSHCCGSSSSPSSPSSSFDPRQWKQSREMALNTLSHLLQQPRTSSSKDLIVVVDDNMHYRSMRFECYRVCRRRATSSPSHSISFCVIHVSTPLSICLRRNAQRTGRQRVAEEVVRRMGENMQRPRERGRGGRYAGVERSAVEVEGMGEEVVGFIEKAWGEGEVVVVRAEGKGKGKDSNSSATLKSCKHQADIRMRKVMGKWVRRGREIEREMEAQAQQSPSLAQVAKEMNAVRREIIQQVVGDYGDGDGDSEMQMTIQKCEDLFQQMWEQLFRERYSQCNKQREQK